MTRPPAGHTAQEADARRDGKITRDLVLITALEIIDRDGADGLSMLRLARALDRDPMILYRSRNPQRRLTAPVSGRGSEPRAGNKGRSR